MWALGLSSTALATPAGRAAGGLVLLPDVTADAYCTAGQPRLCCEWDGVERTYGIIGTNECCGEPDAYHHTNAALDSWTQASRGPGDLQRVLRIRVNHGSAGFFAFMLFALNQMRYAHVRGDAAARTQHCLLEPSMA